MPPIPALPAHFSLGDKDDMRHTDPANFFNHYAGAIEETLLPPVNSVDIAPQVHREYQCRLGNRTDNIAEVFHDNSKNIRRSTRRMFEDIEARDEIIKRQLDTSYAPDPEKIEDIEKSAVVPRSVWCKQVPTVLHPLGLRRAHRFYAIDAYVLNGNELLRILPGKSILLKERYLEHADIKALKRSFFGPLEGKFDEFAVLAFFMGVPWRHMMLYGPRGYRIMLMDLGIILADFEPALQKSKLVQIEHFYDNEIDKLLGFDGITQSVQAIIGVVKQSPKTGEHRKDA